MNSEGMKIKLPQKKETTQLLVTIEKDLKKELQAFCKKKQIKMRYFVEECIREIVCGK